MKRILLFVAFAFLFLSCGKENPVFLDVTKGSVTFELTAMHPGETKAVKTGWQKGDVIFVFFDKVAAPKYLKMTFSGSSWVTAEMNGSSASPDCLGLQNGDAGSMRAVFLPFGSGADVSASGTDFVFSTTYYAYYLTASMDYSVSDNKVSGAFKMAIPEGYVQFYVEDPDAEDGAFTLGTDAVIPVGVTRIDKKGNIVETSDRVAGDDMPGYSYDGGYLFSGKLSSWTASHDYYYFAKTDVKNKSRQDWFTELKTLTSHKSIKLPANGDKEKWQSVGSGNYVTLENKEHQTIGIWHSCNFNQSAPEELGDKYDFDKARKLNMVLPSANQMETLVNECTWHWMSVHGVTGMVVKAAKGFIFLPADNASGSEGHYWTGNGSSLYAVRLYFHQNNIINITSHTSLKTSKYPVRQVWP